MDDILLLTHRIPWPPNKGDKIRSYHLLRHLASHYRVHLGTFVDDPADERYVSDLDVVCSSAHVARLNPGVARWRALTGLLSGAPLTLPYYRNAGLARWVEHTVNAHGIERAVVFSSSMAQYLDGFPALRRVVDLVDVDSDKWRQYAAGKSHPARWIYAREGRRLLEYERRVAREADAALLVSEAEAELFRELAPESRDSIHAVHNGVDTTVFDPGKNGTSPYPDDVLPLVFTGAMDYWPNEEAVTWFADTVFPRIMAAEPGARFYIVGSRPTRGVQALGERPGIEVTGFVDDMRPWLGHAAIAVAPLRIARGVQNKVLEAMAMGRTVIGTAQALAGIEAEVGRDLLQADSPDAFVEQVLAQLREPDPSLGANARDRVLAHYAWSARLSRLDALLQESAPGVSLTDDGGAAEVSHGR
ncbi:TIGR03087 family PEP-CTERM/XrtA system glycosyltransferase [Aquisalimonas asiatica]|uniref:Sugar transferase, PEP-CTERM/EpsH1 system associated n=1 Tax=Aquisalimonas asiatica TaxID=406100 RepID=A0A1H8U4K0_9GAMM|nr:TIGR03087 family PEP-CTERM/XrtA system glycosyltransferase [Aquisalimonas asiatica]SEO97764.1 sugar transferase, PEP-CTERM/EpsH1 system associated [Aquisalimonas asiatica]